MKKIKFYLVVLPMIILAASSVIEFFGIFHIGPVTEILCFSLIAVYLILLSITDLKEEKLNRLKQGEVRRQKHKTAWDEECQQYLRERYGAK